MSVIPLTKSPVGATEPPIPASTVAKPAVISAASVNSGASVPAAPVVASAAGKAVPASVGPPPIPGTVASPNPSANP